MSKAELLASRICFSIQRRQLPGPRFSGARGSVNRPLPTNKGVSSKNSGPRRSLQIKTNSPVKTFQTSKDRVIERYHMTFPETPELQGNTNTPIPNNNLTNLTKRKREEPAPRRRISISEALEKGKGKATVVNEKPTKAATPVKVATPVVQVVASVQAMPPVRIATPIQFAARANASAPANTVTPANAATPTNLVAPAGAAALATPANPMTPRKVTLPANPTNPMTPAKVATPTGPARKFPSKPTPLSTLPPAKDPRHICVNRPVTCEGVNSKKAGRRGPAIKNAGRIFISISSSDGSDEDEDDSDSDSDSEDQVKGLEEKLQECEKKLRDQKGYTRKQVEKSVELERKLIQSEKERKEIEKERNQIQEKLEAANYLAVSQRSTSQVSMQSRQTKKLKRLAQSNRNVEPELDGQPPKFTTGGRTSEPRKGPSMKELYKDYRFTVNDPWGYPTSPEMPTSDPNTFHMQGWQKTPYKFWDQAKLMNIHVHRELTRDRGPIHIITQPLFDGQGSRNSPTENSRSVSLGEPDDEFHWPRGGHRTTFEAFMGIPENMVPAVKGANLGFRAGILVSLHISILVAFNS